jgi:hypothetical protein
MKKMFVPISMSVLLLLGACSSDGEKSTGSGSVNDGEVPNKNGAIDHGVDDKKVGFSLEGGEIEEASGVPAEEKEQILAVYNVYVDTLNEQDIDGYLDTLSPEDYDLDEERKFVEKQFSEYEINREVSNVTIVKYSDKEAQVFSNLKTSYKQISTGLVTKQDGRQVTVFTKNGGDWKASSVHYIGDDGKK